MARERMEQTGWTIGQLAEEVIKGTPINQPKIGAEMMALGRQLYYSEERKFKGEIEGARVALVIPYHPLYETGGLEIGTREIAEGMKERGVRVEIISKGLYEDRDLRGVQDTPEGVRVTGVGSGIEEIVPYLLRRRDDFDVIQWMEIFPPIPEKRDRYNDKAEQQYLASVLLRAWGKDVYLYAATSGNVSKRGTNNPDWLATRTHQPFNALMPVAFSGVNYANPEIRKEYDQAGVRMTEDRQRFIPFGVDTNSFRPVINREEQTKLQKKFGLPAEKLIFFYLGRFVERKRPDLLLSAWKELPANIRDKSHLVFIGGKAGDGQPDSIYPRMRQLMEGVEGISNVDLVPHEVMPEIIRAGDVMVFPTIREGWPLAVLEAMASGKAVISSDIDGVRGVVNNGVNGRLIKADSIEELKAAMTDAVVRREVYTRYGQEVYATVVRQYGWQEIADQYLRFYRGR